MHKKNICHRDLKPYLVPFPSLRPKNSYSSSENLLISKDEIIKICDFGSSKILDTKGLNTPYIVSRYYRAPELILCISKYSNSIDIWATACIISEMITQIPLFQGSSEGDQLFAIFQKLGSPTKRELEILGKKVPYN